MKNTRILYFFIVLMFAFTIHAQEPEKPSEKPAEKPAEGAQSPAEGDKEKPETETEKAEREKKEKEAKEKAEKEKNGIKETNVRMEGEDRVYDLEIDGIPAGTWKEVTRNGEKFYKEVKPESSSTSKEVGIKINESGQVEITSYSSSSGNSGGNSGSTAPDQNFNRLNDTFNRVISNRDNRESGSSASGKTKALSASEVSGIIARSRISTHQQLLEQGREAKRAIDVRYARELKKKTEESENLKKKTNELDAQKKENTIIHSQLQKEENNIELIQSGMAVLIDNPGGEMGNVYQMRGKILTESELKKVQESIYDLNKYNPATLQMMVVLTRDQNAELDYNRRKHARARQILNEYFPGIDPQMQNYVDIARMRKMKKDLEDLQSAIDTAVFGDILTQLNESIQEIKIPFNIVTSNPLSISVDDLEGYAQVRMGKYITETISNDLGTYLMSDVYANGSPRNSANLNNGDDANQFYKQTLSEIRMAIQKGDYLAAGQKLTELTQKIQENEKSNLGGVEEMKYEDAIPVIKNAMLGKTVLSAIYKYGFKQTLKVLATDHKFVKKVADKVISKVSGKVAGETVGYIEAQKIARDKMLGFLQELDQLENGQTKIYSEATDDGPLSMIVMDNIASSNKYFGTTPAKMSVSQYFYRGTYTAEKTQGNMVLYGYFDEQTKSYSPFWSTEENGAIVDASNPNMLTARVVVAPGEVMYRGYMNPKLMLDQKKKSNEQFIFIFNDIEHQRKTIAEKWVSSVTRRQ